MLAITDKEDKSKASGLSAKEVCSDSMLSTDRDSSSSAETLLATPTKRKRVGTALQTSQQNVQMPIKKNTSASKTSVILGKPATTGVTEIPPVEQPKGPVKETSHHLITYNH